MFGFWLVQFAAGLLAGWCCSHLGHLDTEEKAQIFVPRHVMYTAMLEIVYACMFCLVLLNVACSYENRGNGFYGLAIGLAFLAGSLASSDLSIAAFNPAVSLGLDIALGSMGFISGLGCALCNFVGAGVAALLFRILRPEEFQATKPRGMLSRCASEFIGTFFLAVTVLLTLVTDSVDNHWRITSVAAAACLLSLSCSFNTISGSLFNPAVSLGIVTAGRNKLAIVDAVTYASLQCCAGALAGVLVFVGGDDLEHKVVSRTLAGPTSDTLFRNVLLAEFFFTTALVFVVIVGVTTVLASTRFSSGIATSCVFAMGTVTMGVAGSGFLNPALAISMLAVDFLYETMGAHYRQAGCWLLAQFLGGLAGGLLFRYLYWREYWVAKAYMPLHSENEGAAEVGSLVAGNENAGKLVAWGRNRTTTPYGNNRDRSCNIKCRMCTE